ncbi:MAG: putative glycoside hydrolase [Methanobacteriaceae archaeon]
MKYKYLLIALFVGVLFIGLNSAFAAESTSNNLTKVTNTTSNSVTKAVTTSTATSTATKTVAKPTKLSQKVIFTGSKSVKNYINKNGKAPNYITMDNYKFSMPEFLYLVTKATTYKYKGSSGDVTIKYNIKDPVGPSGVNVNGYFKKANYYVVANNIANFITKNNQVPNYASTSLGKMKYQTLLFAYSRIGDYIGTYNKLPSSAYINVKISHSMNRYLPKYTSPSTNTPNTPNNTNSSTPTIPGGNATISGNAVWLHSGDVKNIDLNQMANYGINNIFVSDKMFSVYSSSYINSWLANASKANVKIHVWICVFYNENGWVNPIDTKTGNLNQAFFNTVISKAKTYAAMDNIAGIHLDYLRYPGTAYKTTGNSFTGATAITEFARQLAVATKAINPNIILSAALMPEKASNAYYYGQDYGQLGKYLDVLCPMVYKGNYNAGTAWITSTTKYIVENSGGAQVWVGLQSYVSDSDVTKLSATQLKADVLAALAGGAQGVAIFRWGIANLFSLIGL